MIERPQYQELLETVKQREQALEQWLKKNKHLLSQTDRVKITINIKGNKVIGEITNFPD